MYNFNKFSSKTSLHRIFIIVTKSNSLDLLSYQNINNFFIYLTRLNQIKLPWKIKLYDQQFKLAMMFPR